MHYAEACNEFAGPISTSLGPSNTASFEKMSQRWRTVGSIVSDLAGPRFEPQASRFSDEHVTAWQTGRYFLYTNLLHADSLLSQTMRCLVGIMRFFPLN